jgi:hypothetical protein
VRHLFIQLIAFLCPYYLTFFYKERLIYLIILQYRSSFINSVLYKVLANKTGPYGSLGRSLNMFISLVFDLTTTGLEAVVGAGGGIDIIGAFIPGMTGGNMIVFP